MAIGLAVWATGGLAAAPIVEGGIEMGMLTMEEIEAVAEFGAEATAILRTFRGALEGGWETIELAVL